MNERITEMIMEFAEIAEEYSYVEYAKKQTGYSRQYFYNQKFAELIVRECADLCDRFQARDVGMQPAECASAIRKMFGVEE